MASGEYILSPKLDNGKMVEAQLQKATKEQLEMIRNMINANADIGKNAPEFEVRDIREIITECLL